jgi:hypothetical protein
VNRLLIILAFVAMLIVVVLVYAHILGTSV